MQDKLLWFGNSQAGEPVRLNLIEYELGEVLHRFNVEVLLEGRSCSGVNSRRPYLNLTEEERKILSNLLETGYSGE